MTLSDIPFDDATEGSSIRYRLHPLDVGFDLRAQRMTVEVHLASTLRASYATRRTGERRVVAGSFGEVAEHLRRHGYRLAILPAEVDAYGRPLHEVEAARRWATSYPVTAALAAAVADLERRADESGIVGVDAMRLEFGRDELRRRGAL